jgi:predicted neuraminidase
MLWLAAILLTLLSAWKAAQAPAWPVAFAPSARAQVCIGAPLFQIEKFHIARRRFAHAVSAVLLRDGRMRAVWYEGSRELDRDVEIWTATFDGKTWTAPRAIIGPTETGSNTGHYARKLGNSIIYRDAGGDLVIVYASVIGGWDTASLNLARSSDDGETWSPPRPLTTTPIFNLGTNVRGPAVPTADGLTLLPTSHEFLRPFPEVLLLDQSGRVIGRRRIGVEFSGSQPFLLVLDNRRAKSFSRVDFDDYTIASTTDDVGWSWTKPEPTALRNYDKPVSVARIGGKDLLMVHNGAAPAQTDPARRLMFSVSDDEGRTWHAFHHLELEPDRGMRAHDPDVTSDYPWLMVGPRGLYHLLFTFSSSDQSELIHVRFSRDWIAARGGPPCP